MCAYLRQPLSILKETINGLQSEGRGKQITVISVFTFLYTGSQMSFPVLLPFIRSAYDLDLVLAGLLLTILWLVKAMSQLPSGVLADWVGEGNTLTISALLGGASIIFLVLANNVLLLFVATGIFGIGVSLQAMGRYTTLADVYPDRIGTATGVSLAAADAGQSMIPPLAGIIAAITVWQLGMGFTIPLFLLFGVIIWKYIPGRTSERSNAIDSASSESIRYVFSKLFTKSVLIGTAILAVYLSLWVAFSSFYPTYLIDVKGESATTTSILFGLFFAFGVLIKPLAGTAFDHLDVGRIFVVVGGMSGIALMAFPFVKSTLMMLLLTVLVAPVLGSGTISMSLLLEELPDDIRGSGFGLIRTITMFIASLSPVIFGTVADRGFFDEGFIVLGFLAWAMIPLAFLVSLGDER